MNTSKLNLKLSIFSLIKDGKNPKYISKFLNIKLPALSYYLKQLKTEGQIKKVGYGTWEAIEKNFKFIPQDTKSHLKKDIRSHAFIWKLNLPKIPKWNERETYLKRHKVTYTTNKGYQKFVYKGYKLWLCNSKIIIYFNKGQSYYAKTPQEALQLATTDFLCLVDSLSRFFKVSLRKGKQYNFKLCRKHHALIKNEIAKNIQDKQQKLEIYDTEGKLRIITDKSINSNELEAINTLKNDNDITAIKNFIGSLIEAPFTAYDFATIYRVQEAYAEQIKKHLEVQQETLKTLKAIQEALKK